MVAFPVAIKGIDCTFDDMAYDLYYNPRGHHHISLDIDVSLSDRDGGEEFTPDR